MEYALTAGGDRYLNISSNTMKEWKLKYPDVDIEQEIQKANGWLKRNKSKMWKTLRGFEVWLQRAQDNAPQRAADLKSRGQLHHIEAVQNEWNRQRYEAQKEPRLSDERVSEILGQLSRSLPTYHRPEPKRVDQLGHDHTWSRSFYGGEVWCEGCGLWADQLVVYV